MVLQELMERFYKETHDGPAPITELMGRNEPIEGLNRFRLFMSEKRQEYIKSQSKKRTTKRCRLCFQSESIVYDNHLAIRPDYNPMYDYHMLIRPLKEGIGLENLMQISKNVQHGFVTQDMLDCREYPTKRDIDSQVKIVSDTDYMVMQSMRGSGASVPEHIHSHAFKRALMRFPLLEDNSFSGLYQCKGISLIKIQDPSYGFILDGDPSEYGRIISSFFDNFKIPVNLLFTKISENTIALCFPRVKETPTNPIYDHWQFGVTEMLGLFETKNQEQFDTLSYEQLCQGLRETTVQDSNLQKEMERFLIQTIEGF